MKKLNKNEFSGKSSKSDFGCKTRQQIAAEYGWRSLQTLRNKLKQNKIDLPSGSITPKWQKVIYETFGYPSSVQKEDYKDV